MPPAVSLAANQDPPRGSSVTVRSIETGPQALAPRTTRPTRKPVAATPRVLVLLGVIAALSAALIAVSLARQRADAVAAGEKLVMAFVQLADEQTARTFQSVEQMLQFTGSRLAAAVAAGTASEAAVREDFKAALQNRPFAQALLVVDDKGRVVFDSDGHTIGGDRSMRPYFAYHRDTVDSKFDVGGPIQNPQTKAWSMPASRALRRADGSFAGVIVAVLDPAFFDRVWTAGRSSDAVVGLFRDDGQLLVRSPFDDSVMGKSFAGGPAFEQVRAGMTAGTFETVTPVDGVERIVAFRRLGAYPGFVIVIGQDKAAVLANWRHTVWITVAGAAAVIVAVVVLLTLLTREWRVRRDADERSRLLFEASPYPLFAIDVGDERFSAVNDEAVAKYGWRREEFVGMAVDDLYPPEDLQPLAALRGEVLPAVPAPGAPGAARVVEGLRHRTRTGELLDVELNVRRIDLDGRPTTLVMARDVTDRIRAEQARQAAEEQLRQSQKMEAVGQLTGGVAHDFNNILTIIMANTDALQEEESLDEPVRKRLGQIAKAVMRAAELTRQLLAYSRKQPLRPQPTDIDALVTTTGLMLRRVLGAEIEIVPSLAGDLWPVNVDRTQLETALVNLCVNARDAMPGGGRLSIETANVTLDAAHAARTPDARAGDHEMLAVTDNGSGMPPDVAARIFEPFFTTKGVGKGTGLGLSMVYGFIQQSRGHITVDSGPGRGTSFRLYLPRGEERRTEARAAARPAISGGSERILVVEDEPLVRASILLQLKSLGYDVAEAADGDSGLAACEAAASTPAVAAGGEPYDLLLTDVVMPGRLNGRALAGEVLRRWPGMRVVFMSGYSDNALMEDGRLAADVLLLGKPFRKSDLAQMLRRAFDTASDRPLEIPARPDRAPA